MNEVNEKDFFDVLRETAQERAMPDTSEYRGGPFEWYLMKEEAQSANKGINATVETLKEMIIFEPIPMRLHLGGSWGKVPYTSLVDQNDELHGRWDGVHGTDGEQVTVIVFGGT